MDLDLALKLGSVATLRGGAPASAGISFVGSGKVENAGGGEPGPTYLFSALRDAAGAAPTLAANDFMLIAWSVHSGVDMAIGTPTGFTKRQDLFSDHSYNSNFAVFYKKLVGTETEVTLPASTDGNNALSAAILVLRGVHQTTPFDVADATATGISSGRPDPAAITPTTAGAWIVAAGGATVGGSGVALTQGGDLSSGTNHFPTAYAASSNSSVAAMGFKSDWSAGAFNPAAWGGGENAAYNAWAAATMALRPA